MLTEYTKEYAKRLYDALLNIDQQTLETAYALLKKTIESDGQVFVGGNGGSCSISDHLCCDWGKGTHVRHLPGVRVQSLVANNAMYTALVNDIGPDKALSYQIEMFARPGDLVMLISSSGNSPNIVEAASVSRQKGLKVIGFAGFSGGKLKELADVCVHVAVDNYGIAEDAHQALMHAMSQQLLKERESSR